MTTLTALTDLEQEASYLSHRPIVIDAEDCKTAVHRGNGFSSYRPGHADILSLPRLLGGRSTLLADFLPVLERLSRRSAGSFATISELYANLERPKLTGPDRRAKTILRDFFLHTVDRRLQKLYRSHIHANPPPTYTRHDQKIAALEAVRLDARRIVESYDWRWLADWLELGGIGETAASLLRHLSNLAFAVREVNFRFTYHCNISCRHCYNNSGPHLKALRIPLEPMLAIIGQMPAAGIAHLILTGGEPFLYPDHLTALISAGRAAGLHGISILTNGFWATNSERAKLTLERLAAAGFMEGRDDRLKVSAGVYHQEFIEFNRIATLADSYHAMFRRRLHVDFELKPNADETKKRVKDRAGEADLRDKIHLTFRHVAPLGRGKELKDIRTGSIDTACDSINKIVFDPDATARPCCGLNNENRGVVIGNLTKHTLMDLVKRMQNDPILQFLTENPMNRIFGHLDKQASPHGYSGRCHLCQDAIGDLGDKEGLQARTFDGQKFYPFWFVLAGQTEPFPMPMDTAPLERWD